MESQILNWREQVNIDPSRTTDRHGRNNNAINQEQRYPSSHYLVHPEYSKQCVITSNNYVVYYRVGRHPINERIITGFCIYRLVSGNVPSRSIEVTPMPPSKAWELFPCCRFFFLLQFLICTILCGSSVCFPPALPCTVCLSLSSRPLVRAMVADLLRRSVTASLQEFGWPGLLLAMQLRGSETLPFSDMCSPLVDGSTPQKS